MSNLVRRLVGDQYVVDGADGQHRESGLLGQHGRGRHGDGGHQAGPFPDGATLGHATGQAVQVAGARAQAKRGEHRAHR